MFMHPLQQSVYCAARFFVGALIVSLLSLSTHADDSAQKQTISPVTQSKIERLMLENNVPALGVGIIKDGVLREVKVFGELKKDQPAPYNTIFNVASLAKPIVATLTLKLVSRGEWDLDEPLSKYWVDPDVAADPLHKQLTTRHVLSHQTGFLNWRWLHDSKKLTFDFEPGQKFHYSGEGFEYLRKALEKKFGKPLEQMAQTLLFSPLGMVDTHFYWTAAVDEARFARWHDQDGKNTYDTYKNTTTNAADDLLTTIEDYGRFAAHVLNGANLPDKLYKEMIAPQAIIRDSSHMGLGWEIIPNIGDGEYAVLHSGSDVGVKTLVILLPKSKEGLIFLTNGDNGFNLAGEIVTASLSLGEQIMKN